MEGGAPFRRGGSTGARVGGRGEDGRGAPNLGVGRGGVAGGAPFRRGGSTRARVGGRGEDGRGAPNLGAGRGLVEHPSDGEEVQEHELEEEERMGGVPLILVHDVEKWKVEEPSGEEEVQEHELEEEERTGGVPLTLVQDVEE